MPGNALLVQELMLRRKWTFRAGGQQVVFSKKANEHATHVLMKALIWALYLPAYPAMKVEVAIGDRFKPDLVQIDSRGQPQFWGESGRVGARKMQRLVQRYRATHFAFATWNADLQPLGQRLEKALPAVRRAPVDLLCFPADSDERFIDSRGDIRVRLADIPHRRFSAGR